MIKHLQLKFGRAPDLKSEQVTTTPVTVFVGPNNSGKSLILTEIHQFCSSGTKNTNSKVIEDIEFECFDEDAAKEKVSKVTLKPHANEAVQPDHIIVGKRGARQQLPQQQFLQSFSNPNAQKHQFCSWYLTYNTIILNGNNRINLVNSQPAGNLQQPPQSSFQVLFSDNTKRLELRRIIHEAFGSYLVIDPTNLGHFSLRLSDTSPDSEEQERGIHNDAVQFHAKALPIEQASDGVKAFTGMVSEIIAGDPAILLLDEPEAFLHPSLSFKLGKEISRITAGSEKRLFVSTHSPNFVMGCIQSGTPINIVRLTYRDGVATARILPSADILKLMRDPLLRSTGVLGGLFYEFVVVTEGDADRAFYQEINERLLQHSQNKGVPNCLFLNAQNKQTIRKIIRPLRELGIPVVGIVDVDVLKDGGSTWSRFLESGFVPELEAKSLALLRGDLKKKLDASGKDMKKDGGISVLDTKDKEAAQNLFERLAEYGLFVVPGGELESWLPELNCSGHGPGWLIEVFEKMGEDPESSNYKVPKDEGVWEFIYQTSKWFTNANRKGIPS